MYTQNLAIILLMLFYTKTVRQTLQELDSTEHGLSATEARERLKLYGPNTITVKGEPLWRKLIEPFANVFVVVLALAAIISLFHNAILDAIIIGVIIAASAAIYYVQRFSTERILRSLQKHTIQNIEALREGDKTQIEVSSLVPGDIIFLHEGDKIPADARLIEGVSLRVDESQLTGESQPIDKTDEALSGNKEIYEQSNILFQGSFIVSGEARAVIVTTGNATEFGRLASLTDEGDIESPVQRKIDKLIAQIIGVVAAIALVAFALSIAQGSDFTESIRFVLALSVSAVPESLPVAISVILVLGMRRMAAKKALVRTMRSIESIGVVTTIATDKTGTLTKNQLTVQATWLPHETSQRRFVGALANCVNNSGEKMHDPLDTALAAFSAENNVPLPKAHPLHTFPFDQATAMSGNIWHSGKEYTLFIKGAPEHVLHKSSLTESELEQANAQLHKLTGSGYRVLAVAESTLAAPIEKLGDIRKGQLTFLGFIAVADVLRPEAKKAIQTALKAGVSVRMITGDHFETAYHIGKQLGMVSSRSQVFDSRKMHVMSDEELEETIREIRVFSRVIPEHKYRILSILKNHDITAMTGDGVNDVPALANAHVGIAMGSGASIAKDAGDIILINNNFKSIVDAMREGRTIFANVRRMLFYLLSTNAGEVMVALGALLIGLPVPLAPVQILWINLVTDTSMVIPLGLEPGEKTAMTKPPYRPGAPILSKFLISRMVLLALAMAAVTLGFYASFQAQYGHAYASTIAFSALVVMQWANAFCSRSDEESLFKRLRVMNKPFYIGLLVAISLQALAIFGPLGSLLHITPVSIGDLVITGATAFSVPIIISELHKSIGRRFFRQKAV